MYGLIEKESNLKIEDAIYDEVLEAGYGWMHELLPGQSFRILDLEGNQAVDTTFYDYDDPEDHYGAVPTIIAQKNIYLTTGSILRAQSGTPLLEITADKTGRHDTLGGCCSSQSNTVRYAREKRYMHNCRDSFMLQMADHDEFKLEKRDLAPNINFFMNVPVTKEGGLKFDDGCIGSRQLCRDESLKARYDFNQQLPAAQQSLQRLQSYSRKTSYLG